MRRRALLATAAAASVAGCGTNGGSPGTDAGSVPEQLRGTPTPAASSAWSASFETVEWVDWDEGTTLVGTGSVVVALDAADGSVAWRASLPGPAETRSVNDQLFAESSWGTEPRFLTRLDPTTGDRRWTVRGAGILLDARDGLGAVRRYVDGLDGGYLLLDLATGTKALELSDAREFGGLLPDGTLYLTDGLDVVVRRVDGERVWRRQFGRSVSPGNVFRFGGTVLVAGEDGSVVGLDPADGTNRFRDQLPDGAAFPAAARGRTIYYGSRPRGGSPARLAALNVTSGVAWSRSLAGIAAAPFTAADSLLAAVETDDGRAVAAFDPTDGTPRWRRPGDPVGTDEHGVYVAHDGRLIAIDPAGDERWTAPLPTSRVSESLLSYDTPAGVTLRIARGRVVVAGDTGIATYDARSGRRRVRITDTEPVTDAAVGDRATLFTTENRVVALS